MRMTGRKTGRKIPTKSITENGFKCVPIDSVTLRSDFITGIAGVVKMKTFAQPVIIIAPDWASFRSAFMEIYPSQEPIREVCQSVVEAAIGAFDYKDIEPKTFSQQIDEILFDTHWFYLPDLQHAQMHPSNHIFDRSVVDLGKAVKKTELEVKLLMRAAGFDKKVILSTFLPDLEIPF